MNPPVVSLVETRKRLMNLIKQGENKEIIKILKEIYVSIKKSKAKLTFHQFCDLTGEVFNKNPTFFMEKCYSNFYKKIGYMIDPKQLLELEEFILKKYCLISGEKQLTSFRGRLTSNYANADGRIYLTNQRIITEGELEINSTFFLAQGIPIIDIPIIMILSVGELISRKMRKGKKDKVDELMDQILPTKKKCFGYQFPIKNSDDIFKSKNKIEYDVNFVYIKKGKKKSLILMISIMPLRENKESTRDFKLRKEKVLNILEDTIQKS